jgi:hypothetical protein
MGSQRDITYQGGLLELYYDDVDSDWLPDLFTMEITTATGYNHHYNTRSFSNPTGGTSLL